MTGNTSRLDRLADTDLKLATGERDVRGLNVTDVDGEKLGTVTAIYVDPNEAKVRFIQVKGGGIFGLGDNEHVIPTEAIDIITDDGVRIGDNREHVRGGPTYDPVLVRDASYWDRIYSYYGYPFTWEAAYPVGYHAGRM